MVSAAQSFVADTLISGHTTELKTVIAAFFVGIIVGITGMGGGALMTPALIFLGVGNASSVVTADLVASAVSRSTGAAVHWRHGSPNLVLAGWLIAGSVPMAFLGPRILEWVAPDSDINVTLQICIAIALLFAAASYALRLYLQMRQIARHGAQSAGEPQIRPVPTLLVGMLGGLLVGITSVGAGSVIMIALLTLYPTLSVVKLVGTDLVQAVPLVIAAAASNILAHGLDWTITIPLIIGSVPGTFLGARVAPRVPTSTIRRAIVIILTISGLALLDKSGWWPLGYHDGATSHPRTIVLVGVVLFAALPFVWGLLRRNAGLTMFGKPTVAEIEAPPGSPAAKRAARAARKAAAGASGSPEADAPARRPGAKATAAGRPAKRAAPPAKDPAAPVSAVVPDGPSTRDPGTDDTTDPVETRPVGS